MMSDKFKGKYRIKSARLQNWDYSWYALYYVTICTQNKEFYFGDIAKREMVLSAIGKIAKKYWHEIPQHYPFVELDEFVVMPNHIHGIIIINNPNVINSNDGNAINLDKRDAINRVCTGGGGITGNKNPMLSDGLSKIIRWYKGRVSFESRKIHADFAWHTRFWDHIIRDDDDFLRIKEYIHDNPLKWKTDKFRDDAKS
ncbi:transposase [Ancylomarina sp. YFZ004]